MYATLEDRTWQEATMCAPPTDYLYERNGSRRCETFKIDKTSYTDLRPEKRTEIGWQTMGESMLLFHHILWVVLVTSPVGLWPRFPAGVRLSWTAISLCCSI